MTMLPETKPILFNCPKEYDTVEIYPVHDLHYGNKQFSLSKWNNLKKHILEQPNRFVVWVGDLFENSIPNSKSSDVFEQTCSPQDQSDYIAAVFKELKSRSVAVLDGNHESNRSTRAAGLYPLYTCAAIAGISDRYRSAYAVIDLGVGNKAHHSTGKQMRYTIFATHKAKNLKNFCSADAIEGIDIFLSGHDHEANDHPRGKMVYNGQKRTISFKSVECVNCGSFLSFGGYGAREGYRPKSDKMYKIVLHSGREKQIETVGFYL